MLTGVLIGSIDYFAGNVASNIVDEVMLSIGLRNHAYADDTKNKQVNTAISGPNGVTTTQTTETYKNSVVSYDYSKLIKMQDSWGNFFGTQRFMQLFAPYLLLGALDAGIIAVWVLMLIA